MALETYQSLVRRGKEVFYTPIMKYTIRHYREGRRLCGSNSTDGLSEQTQRIGRAAIRQLLDFESPDGNEIDRRPYMELKQPTVPDFVQMKLDYQGWYHLQSPRDQKIIWDLAMGETTGDVAKKYGVSAGLISIKRKNFAKSWNAFINAPEKTDLACA
jgi:hypothetical protein